MIFQSKDAAKSDDPRVCDLSSEAVTALEKWLDERRAYEKYDDRDALWLNQRENRYLVKNTNRVFRDRLDEAGIENGVPNLTWYYLHHGAAR